MVALGDDGSLKFTLEIILVREVKINTEIKAFYKPNFVPQVL